MEELDYRDKKINKISCEFGDKKLEEEYFNHSINKSLGFIKNTLVILSILFMLFAIPDYYLMGNNHCFYKTIVIRLVISSIILFLYFLSDKIKKYSIFSYLLTITEVIAVIGYFMIINNFETINYLIKTMDLIIIILAIFMIPNKWINMIIASSFVAIGFFIYSILFIKNIYQINLSASVVYILIVITISSIMSHRECFNGRSKYLKDKDLQRISETDSLTGIYNRSKYNEEFYKWLNMNKRYGIPVSIILFDMDDFKNVNDSYGHVVGDEVLLKVIKVTKSIIRETDIFVRWGGEEFVLLLPETNIEQATELSERIRKVICNCKFKINENFTCSFGVTEIKNDDEPESLISRADKLMYMAKRDGKNKVMS